MRAENSVSSAFSMLSVVGGWGWGCHRALIHHQLKVRAAHHAFRSPGSPDAAAQDNTCASKSDGWRGACVMDAVPPPGKRIFFSLNTFGAVLTHSPSRKCDHKINHQSAAAHRRCHAVRKAECQARSPNCNIDWFELQIGSVLPPPASIAKNRQRPRGRPV